MQIKFAKRFTKQYDKANSKVKFVFDKKLNLFIQNPFNPQLNNHALTGKLSGLRSINISGDWRALYSEYKKVVIFEMFGTHNQLYK